MTVNIKSFEPEYSLDALIKSPWFPCKTLVSTKKYLKKIRVKYTRVAGKTIRHSTVNTQELREAMYPAQEKVVVRKFKQGQRLD